MIGNAAWILVGIALGVTGASAAVLRDGDGPLIDTVQSESIRGHHRQALALVDSVSRKRPDDPLPLLLELSIRALRDLDYETPVEPAAFFATYDRFMDRCPESPKDDSLVNRFRLYRGFGLATLATYLLRTESYRKALSAGWEALDLFEKVQEAAPDNSDAAYFPGLYEFAKADLKKRFWWMMFWYPTRKSTAFDLVKRSATRGLLTRQAARLSLVDMYVYAGRWEDADSLLSRLELEFPRSRFVLWARAKYFEKREKTRDAVSVYRTLVQRYERSDPGWYNQAITRLRILELERESGELPADRFFLMGEILFFLERGGDDPRVKEVARRLEKVKEGTE